MKERGRVFFFFFWITWLSNQPDSRKYAVSGRVRWSSEVSMTRLTTQCIVLHSTGKTLL